MRNALLASLLFVALAQAALTQPAFAQPQVWNGPLSREQAVLRATAAGFDVRMARADASAARGQALGQRSAVLPQVSLSGNQINAHLPQLGMPEATQTYASATASVPIINVAGYSGVRMGRRLADASSADLGGVVDDAAFAAVKAYDRAVLGAGVALAQQVSVGDQEANVRLVELRVQAGKTPRYELARARAALAGAQQMAEDAAAERDEALNDLKLLLDFDMMSNLELPNSFSTPDFNDTLATASQRALRQRPAVAAARLRIDAARAGLDQARAAYLPTAALTAQTYNGSSNPPLGASGSQVGVAVTLPIVEGGARHAAVLQASAALEKAQADYERQQLMVQDDVANALRELSAARQNLQTARAATNDALENLRVASLRQKAGKAIELEVLDALSTAAAARITLLQALERYDVAIAGVHHAAGDPFQQ
ncbi:MAG TPA: TolC family protein [Candidatus Tumulicola sp.]|nr:TolC family protein [Candidatus Tumulicola sp.]